MGKTISIITITSVEQNKIVHTYSNIVDNYDFINR